MKRKFLGVMAGLLIGTAVMAALDATLLQNVVIMKPQEIAGATEVTSTVVDKMPFTGVANIVVTMGVNTGATVNVQLQTAPNATGTFASVTGATAALAGTNGATATIPYDTTGGSRYVRLLATNSNAGAEANIAATINSYR